MAECYDRFGRVGGKARGTRSQFRLNTEGLLPFKCTYPAHLTDVMDAVPSTQSDLRRADLVSPVRGTRTRAVREYEQTIEELKKENFDLKLRLFLLEDTKNKNYLRNKGSNNEDQDNTVQVIVELKLETEALRTELTTNKQLLHEANEQKEKYVSDLKELQDKFDQLQEELSTVTYHPSEQEIRLLKDENESLQKSNEFSNKIISEKDQEIENLNVQLEDLSNKNKALEAKVKKSSLAIQGIVSKYYKDIEMIPKEIRPIVQTAVQAAKENRKMDLVNAIESFKASVSELISTDGNESKETTSKDSMEELQKLTGVGKSLEELTQNKGQSHHRSKLTCDGNKSSDSIHESEKSGKNESREDLDQMFDVVKENENLKVDIAEKSKIIDNMNAACNEFEKKIALLQNELSDALSKVKDLEIRINEEKGKQISSLPTKDSAMQTAVQWHSMQFKISDKFLQNAGHSNNLDDLKEEVLTLLLVIEQKDKDISDFEQQIKSLQTQLDQENKKDVSFANLDKDYVRERSELRQRLAHSCAINNELMVHLRNLEVFMEDLLQHKNLDGSSLENISANSGFLSHWKIQREIEQSLELTSVLNDELSICEGSKIFDPNDASVNKDFNQSHQPVNTSRLSLNNSNIPSVIQGRNNPSQLSLQESPTNAAGTGKRRLSFSTLHNSTLDTTLCDSENVVVLGTSNNEDLILLLNEKGDPEDVLIRNNHSYMDKNSPAIDNGEQLRRRCWESSTMNYLNIERAVMEHRTEQWCDSKLENPNAVHLYPSSDSDIWSEPDRDVSLQRIGIDLQKSPVSQKSPRRSRFRDKSTDGVSSQKNESSSSFSKLHTWSKRRRNSDTLKSSSICKKCMSHFQPSDTPSKEGKIDSFQKAIDQLSNTCNYQENQLEKAVFELRSKKDIIDSLIKEKQEMLNYIDHLKETNETVAEQDSESAEKMSKLSMENMKLQNLIRELESRMSHSEGVYNQMKAELEKTKTQLKLLEAKCMEYEEELVLHSNFKNDYTQRLKEVEKEKTKLLDEIETLLVEKNELLSIIEAEKSEKQHFEKENQVLKNKLEENSKEMSLLKESSKNLELVKNELYKERQTIKELLCKIEDEKENRQHFMQENHALKRRLEENSKEVSLLKASSKDLEHVENELLREREMVKELLHKLEAEHENTQHFEKENHALKRRLEENSKEVSLLKASSKDLEHVENELLREREMVKELLHKIEAEHENTQHFEKENHALKRRLEENSKEISLLKASSKDLEHVENELLREREMVKELLHKIEAEHENTQHFEKENHALKRRLEENSKEVSLLKASSKDLEHVENELLREREMVKELLHKIEAEHENTQHFEKENHALKRRLEENSKELSLLKASSKTLEHVKNELLNERQMVKELLSKIEAENENKQYFEEENHALKRRLEENSKEISLLKASSKDLEHVKNELLRERQMVKELLSKIEAENENKQYFEKEIHALKSKLEENSKEVSLLRASSKDLEYVKNELLKEKQMVKELLSKIEAENENKQYFEKEIHALKSKLEENSKEVSLLKASNEDLENIKNELLKEKEKSETDLLSSHSMCNELQNDLKKIKDRLKDAESKCIRYETELNESLKYQHFIFKSLSSVKDEVFANLDSLAYVCKEYLNADFGNIVDKKSPLSVKDKPDQIGKLFEDIFGTCTNFDQMLQFLSEQLSFIQSLKEKSKTIDEENKSEIVKLQKLLDKKEKEIQSIEIQSVNLQQKIQENKEKECKLESMQQKLEMAENELNVLNERKTKMEVMVKEFQETLRNKEKSLEDLSLRNSASERQLDGFKSEIQMYQNLLNMKDDEITKLQERIFNMQTHINNLLTNKTSLSAGQMSSSSKDDIKGNMSNTSDAPSISRDSSFSSIASEKDDDVYKKFEKYSKKIKALQTKLSITEKRIEILEKEKADLREEFFAQIQKDKTKTKSSEELEALSKELIELKTTLKTKTSFIKDLKNELFKTCNSLVDKQKEVDELQHKLSAARKNAVAKSPSSPLELNSQYSDPIHKSVEANIKELKNHKWELIQGILKQQKVFYEKKNIHLGHFEKFKNHIEKLRSLQISQSLFKSGSEPLLNTPTVANSFYAEKCDKTLKNLQIELQLDVECLQNLKIFLKRFFIPLVLQNCSCAATSPKPDDDSHDGKQSNQASSEMKDMKKELKLDLLNSSSVEVLRLGSASSSSDRLISTASVVAHNLESVENALKKVKHILQQFEENNSLVGETPKKTAAKSLLLKMMKEITSLQENSEIFHLNSVLKSLGLFDIHIPQSPSKQDMSDRESLLSEETIALSRSGSLSPMSFEENFPSKLYTSGVRQKQESESFGKNESGNKQLLGISQKLALGGSQDSLFLRSHFSSPDLGIESDPNHESSAPEQQEKDFRDGSIRMSKRHLPESSYNFTDTSVNIKEVSSAIGDALHAIGYLQEYELLKKEVQESLVGIKTVLTRTGDGLQHVAKFTSPQKNLEYSTFKAIKDACGNIEVCLQKAIKLVDNFWVAPCPSVKELNMLIQQNRHQQQKLKILHESKQRQERYLEEITEKYKQAERYRENVEKKISKKLVKTKKVIRRAEFKILEKENQDLPSIPKYPFDESACQSRS